jgi:hypothetical protein
LGQEARKAVDLINRHIPEEKYKFHFSNHDTLSADSRHKEQRLSASYYAVTRLGIPAYGLETSKQLPSLEMKVRQHNLAVNAFMELYGVIAESPRVNLAPPSLNYLVISVNGGLPIAATDGQTLLVREGDTVEVIHVGANYDRGLSVDVMGLGSVNDIRLPLSIHKPTEIIARRDHIPFGRVKIGILPKGSPSPQLKKADPSPAARAGAGVYATTSGKAEPKATPVSTDLGPPSVKGSDPAPTDEDFEGFLLEVDEIPVRLKAEGTLIVSKNSTVKMVGLASPRPIPKGAVMNLRGFIGRPGDVTGDDQGTTALLSRDLIPRFALPGRANPTYRLAAELGKETLFKAYIEVPSLKLKNIALNVSGQDINLPLGGRIKVKPGQEILVKKVELAGGVPLKNPRYTLGGRQFPANLPQKVVMPNLAVALAVTSDGELARKAVLVPGE